MSEDNIPKILIVDDEPMNIELIEACLTDDYEILTASNGNETIETVQKHDPDLILLDIMMPEMDGYEVCKILKSQPQTQFTPIVMVTALSDIVERIKGIEVGADDFLTKPVNRLEMTTRVKSLLRVKQLHDIVIEEKEQLEMQNRVRSVLTAIIPILIKTLPAKEKNVVIQQMTDMVEKTILAYLLDQDEDHPGCVGDVCIDVMNQLGGTFNVEQISEFEFNVKGTKCPWGTEEARRNPILCNLTRGIISKMASRKPGKWNVKVLKTMGNGDECCLFDISQQT
ncbi:MAG: methanogen output domain 1-containing protein [Methanosarcinaceae archaeon]|nr:methanogen output domain 1-containing protein [Methanosarcinaceae archaeon]